MLFPADWSELILHITLPGQQQVISHYKSQVEFYEEYRDTMGAYPIIVYMGILSPETFDLLEEDYRVTGDLYSSEG